jgi:hypothetical protein
MKAFRNGLSGSEVIYEKRRGCYINIHLGQQRVKYIVMPEVKSTIIPCR